MIGTTQLVEQFGAEAVRQRIALVGAIQREAPDGIGGVLGPDQRHRAGLAEKQSGRLRLSCIDMWNRAAGDSEEPPAAAVHFSCSEKDQPPKEPPSPSKSENSPFDSNDRLPSSVTMTACSSAPSVQ